MRGRRSILHILSIAAVIGLSIAGLFEAATTVIDPSTGRVLMVDVVQDQVNPTIQGIRYRERWPQGQTTSEDVQGTWDEILDQAPSISLNPAGGIVVVWSRHDGADFELNLARREAGAWSSLRTLTFNSTFDTNPQVLVSSPDVAHIAWWGNGAGGPFYLQTFNVLTGAPIGPRYEPINVRRHRPRHVSGGTYDDAGGMDEPGIPTSTGTYNASALPCTSNPEAAPEHGVVMACGMAGAYQLSSCELIVGVRKASTSEWSHTSANLSTANLQTTSVREIVQSIADYNCNQ